MAILKIQIGTNNPILRTKSKKVQKVDANVKKLIKDMQDTLHLDGVGLAAPQVGQNLRVILIIINAAKVNQNMLTMINPEILFFSEDLEIMEEGCLSLPKIFKNVARSKSITVKYQDLNLHEHVLQLSGFNARIVQHEVDHIDGILFIDRAEGNSKF
ncbi:MAG: peptide deformylase, peptide deformylase [Candidatus Peregrinibacteria bacterium GW2011_GWF2_33_10]|nr:MAG: peptide deformylase, peptide deformylase [Candidatus Peregrinibacteria bacterium GW2011_GWF2_33_10]OGJ44270.1 MAG: peptide deformylase [Candidatus Peregrinibacteria bacterium RIFOXYA2_FULL_33_21]OGJ45101.1 MAG: peptide deformylase [Candidatus Peregrinibacteria bacterium RIFOXYA12_FULL_33_12]OGJ50091.1 MAG: peptide deformylase [Candidatus Peregrinibacteria bacterium RIFOXYB2_FULL_33_20]